ncbi:MAG: hypothetical protein NTY38_17585, partial [Acidobacteria bacterium]|nr:hypothetical protein [Acidobacteriota bacterium]
VEQGTASEVNGTALTRPLEVDLSLKAEKNVVLWATAAGRKVPYLISRRSGKGTILTWNVRTFNEADYAKTNERLLAPALLGLPELPQAVADAVRERILSPLGVRLSVPSGVAYYQFGNRQCLYNFLDQPVEARLNGATVKLPANALVWGR